MIEFEYTTNTTEATVPGFKVCSETSILLCVLGERGVVNGAVDVPAVWPVCMSNPSLYTQTSHPINSTDPIDTNIY